MAIFIHWISFYIKKIFHIIKSSSIPNSYNIYNLDKYFFSFQHIKFAKKHTVLVLVKTGLSLDRNPYITCFTQLEHILNTFF